MDEESLGKKADLKRVGQLAKFLSDTLDKFLDDNPEFHNLDVFMAAHNFHKFVVLKSVEGQDEQTTELICNMAATTFELAMQKKNLYEKDNN